jgi:hypothetical protein
MGGVVGGLSGFSTDSNDIRIWVGNAIPTDAPFKVLEDGSLIATQATITGEVTANSGKIGGFTIDNGNMDSDGEGELTFTAANMSNAFGLTTESKNITINGNPNGYTEMAYDFSVLKNRKTTIPTLSSWQNILVANAYNITFKNPIGGKYGYQYADIGNGHIIMDGIVEGVSMDLLSFTGDYQVQCIRPPFNSNRIVVNSTHSSCIFVLPDLLTMQSCTGYNIVSSRNNRFTFSITIINTGTTSVRIIGRNAIQIGSEQPFFGTTFPLFYNNGNLNSGETDNFYVQAKRASTLILSYDGSGYYAMNT